jgi:hypothetical protein
VASSFPHPDRPIGGSINQLALRRGVAGGTREESASSWLVGFLEDFISWCFGVLASYSSSPAFTGQRRAWDGLLNSRGDGPAQQVCMALGSVRQSFLRDVSCGLFAPGVVSRSASGRDGYTADIFHPLDDLKLSLPLERKHHYVSLGSQHNVVFVYMDSWTIAKQTI